MAFDGFEADGLIPHAMNDDRWARVKALFQAAIERPAPERLAFLAAEADDEAVRREVESLLASDAGFVAVVDESLFAGNAVQTGDPSVQTAPADGSQAGVVLKPGARVGSYEVLSPLGAGAMGEVYHARDTKLNRDVALKVLPQALAVDPDHLARFRREAQVLAALNHPNVAAIYGLEESGGVRAIVLELVDGPTLADRIAHGPLPLDDVLSIGRQIAQGVEAAHDKGIIHRDLKPSNIKIAGSGAVKVLDFGLAKFWQHEQDGSPSASPKLTATIGRDRMILGTPAYMSPEQARGRALDKRADIWSFGCVLFEMLTGRAAFGDETISDTLARVLDSDVDWESMPASAPARLRDLVRRCLQKDANRRLRDIGDARIELDEMLSPPPLRVAESAVPRPLETRSTTRGLARPLLGLAALVLTFVAAVFLTSRAGSTAPPSFRELTFRHGTISGARLASDGQTVVYGATWTGSDAQVYIVRPENPQSGPISLGNAGIYAVSSRGDLAVALGCRFNWGECLGTLGQVPLTGGSPREIMKDVLVADWSPDGQNLAVVSFRGDKFRIEYPIGNVIYQPPGWITFVRVSPTGDRIAFLDHPDLGDTAGSVSVVDLTGRKTTLSSNWKSLQGLAWSGSGNEIWFAGSRNGKGGSSALYAVTLAGAERTVFSSPATLKLNDISRDGRRVLVTRGTTRGAIRFGAEQRAAERDLSWFDYSTLADLSSDGRTLLFYEWGEGVGARPTIFVRNTDGSDPVRLGEGRPLALSPDRRWALAVQGDAADHLGLLPTGVGEPRSLPNRGRLEFLGWAAWSPDSRRIFFAGRDGSDVRRTYVQDVDGGESRPITPEGYVGILLSPDARSIAAVDRYGEYYVCSVDEAAEPRPLAGYLDGDVPIQWSADGRFLFMREAGNLFVRIHQLDLSTGIRRMWKELTAPDPAVLIDIGSDPGQIRVTPDGRSWAYTYWTSEGTLYLAEGLK